MSSPAASMADARPGRSRAARGAATLVLALALVAMLAAPAAAHAQLVETVPGPGQVLTSPPTEITLRFSESVQVGAAGVRLFDSRGSRIAMHAPEASGSSVRVAIGSVLDDGAYVVTWRVISADSHPVAASFTFQVGTAASATSPDVLGLAQRLLADEGGNGVVGVVYAVARVFLFAAVALLLGAAVFLTVVWRAGVGERRARILLWTGWAGAGLATVLAGLVYGPYSSSLSLGHVFDGTVLSDLLSTRYGAVALARLGFLLLALPLLRVLLHTGSGRFPTWWLPASSLVAIGLAATPALSGHAVAGSHVALAVVADTVHVLAMGAWLGGLVVLGVALLPGRAAPASRDPVRRFSRLAFGAVLVLVVTGTFAALRQVDSLAEMHTTDYGRLLLAKLVGVAVLVGVASFTREVTARLWGWPGARGVPVPVVSGGAGDLEVLDAVPDEPDQDGPGPDGPGPDEHDVLLDEEREIRALRRSVGAEVVVAFLLLVVTAVLVNAAPPRIQAAASGGAAVLSLSSRTVLASVVVLPAQRGSNEIHLTTTDAAGTPFQPLDATATLDLPGRRGLAPIDLSLFRLGPGHWTASGVPLPFAGTWRFTLRVRTSDVDESVLVGTFKVT